MASALICICLSCSRQQYVVSNVAAQRYPVVRNEIAQPDARIVEIVGKYKHLLDKEMNQVIAYSEEYMPYGRPESLLTNFTSDLMLDYARSVGKDCDLSLMNVNGHRSNMPQGNIKVGDIYEIYSFENALVVLQLKGNTLMDIFESYAEMGGAGVSSNVRLLIKDRRLAEATINGMAVDKDMVYTVVTLDYLADGNDGMEDMKKALGVQPIGITLRDAVFKYIEGETKQGKKMGARLDGRISVVQ